MSDATFALVRAGQRARARATSRKCGDCTLCCRLMPTAEIGKPANVRCQHQCLKGCRIYANRPASCSLWSCRWLVEDDTGDQPRPDRSHIVIDMLPDVIRAVDNETGKERAMGCVVAWIDPNFPDAWQHAAFQRYVARQTMPVLLRLSDVASVGVLFPPAVTGEGMVFRPCQLGQTMPVTLQQKAAALGATLELPEGDTGPATLTMPDGTRHTVQSSRRWPA